MQVGRIAPLATYGAFVVKIDKIAFEVVTLRRERADSHRVTRWLFWALVTRIGPGCGHEDLPRLLVELVKR